MAEYHSPRFWGLDPLFSSRVKLSIKDAVALQPYPDFQGVYCMLNHPIVNVHIMGDVVSVHKKNLLISYEVDDGTGVVSCCQWRKAEGCDYGLTIPALGQLVSVCGKLSEFRGERQIKVSSIFCELDPNAEPLHWLEVAQLKRTIYSQPFTLPPGVSSSSHNIIELKRYISITSFLYDLSISNLVMSPEKAKAILREALSEVILGHLKTQDQPFTLSKLKRSDDLKKACLTVTSSSCNPSLWTEEELSRELCSVIASLPGSGHVIPTPSSLQLCMGAMETEYQVLVEEKHLYPAIKVYMRQKLKHPGAAKLGVKEEWIVEHLKKKEVFSQLPNLRITDAIKHLCESSIIFPVGPKAYKCV